MDWTMLTFFLHNSRTSSNDSNASYNNSRCTNSSYSINASNEEALKKLTKSKLKTDLKNLPPLIPKPMQDWFNSTLNGTLANGVAHFENNASSNNTSSNGDVIEVDPWACSMNQDNFNEDSDLKPSQSKLRKLLSEHQVRIRLYVYLKSILHRY